MNKHLLISDASLIYLFTLDCPTIVSSAMFHCPYNIRSFNDIQRSVH